MSGARLDRWLGLLLFLPVPAVLVLLTRAPFGLPASFGLGLALMLSHRLYARPWALARAARRCLWCARPAGGGPPLTVVEPGATTTVGTCGEAHRQAIARVLAWAWAHRLYLRAGILGSLALLLVAALAISTGRGGPLAFADASALFRLGIALSVLPLALRARRGPVPADPPASPFPLHVPALIGLGAVLWLFRLIGLAWLVLAAWHLAGATRPGP